MIKLVNRLMILFLIISLTSAHRILANSSQMLTPNSSFNNQLLVSNKQNNSIVKTVITLLETPNPSVVGQKISLLAVVDSIDNLENPTGIVEFFDNNDSLGRVELIDARAALEILTLSVGEHLLTAKYYGNAKFSSSSSQEIKQIITKTRICTTVFNPSYPYRVVGYIYQAADFNNDNIDDLVCFSSHEGRGTIDILLSSGTPEFIPNTPEFIPKTIRGRFGSISIGDFNNDKNLDLYAGSVIFFGDGKGNFKEVPRGTTFPKSFIFATVDLNKDNGMDLISLSSTDDYRKTNIIAYLGNGNNDFIDTNIITSYLSPLALDRVIPADINNDTNLDLLIHLRDQSSRTSSSILIFLGDGKGQFKKTDNDINVSYRDVNEEEKQNKIKPFPYINSVAADLNNDKNIDIVIALSNRILIYYGDGEGKFNPTEIIGKCDGKIATSDLNQDGNIDIIVNDRTYTETSNPISLIIYFGDGKGGFNKVAPPIFVDTRLSNFTIGHFNQDSLPDLAVSYVAQNPLYRGPLTIISTYNEGCYGDRASDTTLFADTNKTSFGQTITFTAKVKSSDGDGLCTGTVSFFAQGKVLERVNLSHNQATLKINSLNAAAHRITAVYSGDSNYSGSFSNSLIQNIAASGTSISIASSPNAKVLAKYPFQSLSFPSIVGNELTIMAAVVALDGDILPSGTVEFFNGDQSLGTAPLKPEYLRSEATLKIDTLPLGNHKLSAKFLDNNNFNSSNSQLLTHKVYNPLFCNFTTSQISDERSFEHIVSGDFNNDKRLDIAVFDKERSTIAIFINKGNGHFSQAKKDITVDSFAEKIVTADFNNDNNLDLAVLHHNDKLDSVALGYTAMLVSVFLNNGQARFSRTGTTHVKGSNNLIVADFNNDNNVDLIMKPHADDIKIYWGDGKGKVKKRPTVIDINTQDIALATGDFNNDKRLDVAVSNFFGGEVFILKNDNRKFINVEPPTNAGTFPTDIVSGDFNNDRQTDLAVLNRDHATFSFLLNKGNRKFIKKETLGFDFSKNIEVGDFNNDYNLDILIRIDAKTAIAILLGNGEGEFTLAKSNISSDSYAQFVTVGDFNNDKIVDIVFITEYGLYISLGNGCN